VGCSTEGEGGFCAYEKCSIQFGAEIREKSMGWGFGFMHAKAKSLAWQH